MKHTIISILFILTSISVSAYIPEWVIRPESDTILVKTTGLLQGKVNGENIIWTMDGKKLYSTDKHINDFNNGFATIQDLKSEKLLGFIDIKGHFNELPETYATYKHPHFTDGYLVTKNNYEYELYSKDGQSISLPPIHTLYPYSNGYAPYLIFLDTQKQKKNHFNYLKPNGQPLETFVIKDNDKRKEVEPKDIMFLSSIDSDGKAIAVVKNKLYWFDKLEMCLTPFLKGEETDKKRHLTLDTKEPIDFTQFPIDSLTLHTKYGKDQRYDLHFDHRLRLIPEEGSSAMTNSCKNQVISEFNSSIKTYSDGQNEGIILNGKDTIPCQFEKIGISYDNKVAVKFKGKWGILAINPDYDVEFEINEGEDIPFRHKTFQTTLRVDLPSMVKPELLIIEIPKTSGIHIDNSSCKRDNIGIKNVVSYECTLDVPSELSDTISPISYGPLAIWIDEVRLPNRAIETKGMFINHLNIDIPTKTATVTNRKVTFEINVKSKEEALDSLINLDLHIDSDALITSIENISETDFRCTADSLKIGVNELIVKVAEKGCPYTSFPIEIEYNNRKRETVAVKQKIGATIPDSTIELLSSQEETNVSHADNNVNEIDVNENDFTLQLCDISDPTPQPIMFINGYTIAEVISDNAEFRAGAGRNFPISIVKNTEAGKEATKYPYKGQLLIVKENNDWYRVYGNFFNQKNSEPKYISKIDAKPLKSTTFKLDESTKPTTYVKVNKETNEYGESGYFAETIVIYPNGIFVKNKDSFWNSTFSIGTYSDGQQALMTPHHIDSTFEYDRSNEKDRVVRISDGKKSEKNEIFIMLPSSDKKYITFNEINIPYPDLSKFNEDEWRSLFQKIISNNLEDNNGYITTNNPTDLLVTTKDLLEKNYTKVK